MDMDTETECTGEVVSKELRVRGRHLKSFLPGLKELLEMKRREEECQKVNFPCSKGESDRRVAEEGGAEGRRQKWVSLDKQRKHARP